MKPEQCNIKIGTELIDESHKICVLVSKDEWIREAKKEWVMLKEDISDIIDDHPDCLLVKYPDGKENEYSSADITKYWRVPYECLEILWRKSNGNIES